MLLRWSGRHPSRARRDHRHAIPDPTLAIGHSSSNDAFYRDDNIDCYQDTYNHPHRIYTTLSHSKLHTRTNVYCDANPTPTDQHLHYYTNRYSDDYAD